jgi:hypothetical protein
VVATFKGERTKALAKEFVTTLVTSNPAKLSPGKIACGKGFEVSVQNQLMYVELSVLYAQPAGLPTAVMGAFTSSWKEIKYSGEFVGALLYTIYVKFVLVWLIVAVACASAALEPTVKAASVNRANCRIVHLIISLLANFQLPLNMNMV